MNDHRDLPVPRILSLGAGPQSTTLLLLACEGRIPAFDAAIFADSGWLHAAVHERLVRLEQIAADAGTPLYRVSGGDVRTDALDPSRRFASMPLWYRSLGGHGGSARRQCVTRYKTRPVKAKVRELLGYPPPARVPRGRYAELAIGLGAEETSRARQPDVAYLRYTYPLADLGWDTAECVRYLVARGFSVFPAASCLGCPFHGNRWWRYLRDDQPDAWADVVAFDHAIRNGHPRARTLGRPLDGEFFVHSSREPLEKAYLGPVHVLDGRPGHDEEGVPGGCSPWTLPANPAVSRQVPGWPRSRADAHRAWRHRAARMLRTLLPSRFRPARHRGRHERR